MKKVTTWHKNVIKRFQEKTKLSDYKMLWVSFIKGLVIGAIIL